MHNKKAVLVGGILLVLIAGLAWFVQNRQKSQLLLVRQTQFATQYTPEELATQQSKDKLVNSRFDIYDGAFVAMSAIIAYPLGWELVHSGTHFGETRISLYKGIAQSNNKDYICLELSFRNKEFYVHNKFPGDHQAWGGKKTTDIGNNYFFYEWDDNEGGYLVDGDMKDVVSLPNDLKLKATVRFNCIQSDGDNMLLSKDQIKNSSEYREAQGILTSIVTKPDLILTK